MAKKKQVKPEIKLTPEQLTTLDQRREGHLSGKDKSTTWPEAHKRIVAKRKKRK